jgi:tetratricopeptide (TPR) repeat protein
MRDRLDKLKCVVAAFAAVLWLAPVVGSVLAPAPLAAQEAPSVADLLQQLRDPGQENWRRIERQIVREWSKSVSASADLLLFRGREALRIGDTRAAIDHFSALIDHAPDFAEGWNARATAYFMAGRFGQSLADIRETLARNPDHFGALAGLARILEDLERYDEAQSVLQAAAAIHPHRSDIQAALERVNKRLEGTAL